MLLRARFGKAGPVSTLGLRIAPTTPGSCANEPTYTSAYVHLCFFDANTGGACCTTCRAGLLRRWELTYRTFGSETLREWSRINSGGRVCDFENTYFAGQVCERHRHDVDGNSGGIADNDLGTLRIIGAYGKAAAHR